MIDYPKLLTKAEVAERFRVCTQTVSRWTKQGKLTSIWTPGGQRRYSAEEVTRLLGGYNDVH